MTDHQQIIRRGLEEMAKLQDQTEACWITFQANEGEHWIQCTPGQVNMDWPFSHPPEEDELSEYFGAVGPLNIVAWDADCFVTFDIQNPDVSALACGVDRIFQEFYELGPDYGITFQVEF